MKLQSLKEASYHLDPHEQFLNNYFEKVDTEDNGDGTYMEWWQIKGDLLATVEFEEETYIVSSIIVGIDPEQGKNSHNISVFGWDQPLPSEYDLKDITVYKKVS